MPHSQKEWLTRKEILEHIYQRPLSKKELNRFYEYERKAHKKKIYSPREKKMGGGGKPFTTKGWRHFGVILFF